MIFADRFKCFYKKMKELLPTTPLVNVLRLNKRAEEYHYYPAPQKIDIITYKKIRLYDSNLSLDNNNLGYLITGLLAVSTWPKRIDVTHLLLRVQSDINACGLHLVVCLENIRIEHFPSA